MTNAAAKVHVLQDCAVSSIYLMGASFALGSLFTVVILIILEAVRRRAGSAGA